jgi:hypothetical protein
MYGVKCDRLDHGSYAQRLQAKGMTGAEVVSVNMHRLGEIFV